MYVLIKKSYTFWFFLSDKKGKTKKMNLVLRNKMNGIENKRSIYLSQFDQAH